MAQKVIPKKLPNLNLPRQLPTTAPLQISSPSTRLVPLESTVTDHSQVQTDHVTPCFVASVQLLNPVWPGPASTSSRCPQRDLFLPHQTLSLQGAVEER